MTTAIAVEGLSKCYQLGMGGGYRRFTEVLSGVRHRKGNHHGDRELWALKDVSFDVQEGQVIGVIGRNGSGKSTLLKILSRITEPTSGRAVLHGRVGSLLEVGTGFHPELSGRENIFLNGAVLGMRQKEIQLRFDEIVAFAEVERFLDTPVKRYSSGMYVRLAFAVAAHLEPEILVVDEVLAVGDAAFQRKCLGKMSDVARSGRTVLFVSHNMAAIRNLCSRAVRLDHGVLVQEGDVNEVVRGYLESHADVMDVPLENRADREGTGRLRLTSLRCRTNGSATAQLVCGEAGDIDLHYRASGPLNDVQASIGFASQSGEGALILDSEISGSSITHAPAEGILRCHLDRVPLLPGRYSLNLYVTVAGQIADWIRDAVQLEVADGDFFGSGRLPPPGYGSVAVTNEWSVV